MPWAIRSIEEGKDCSFLNLWAGDKIPQLVIHEHIREKAGKNSTWLVPKTFSTCHPLKFASKAQASASTESTSHADTPEMILLLQEQCRQEWGSEFPKPVKVGFQNGQPIIKFKNHEGDKNPSSYVLGDYRKLVIQGNNGQPGNWYLPDQMTAAEFTDFTARRCGTTKVSGAAWTSPAPARFRTKSNGNSDFFSQMLTAAFYQQSVVGDITGIRNHQRELLRREVGYMRCAHGPYLMKSAEGFGKTSSHFPAIRDEMFDFASAQPWGSPALFGCFASYPQAEEKANEFREQHPESNRAAVIKSFHSIYREFCEQEGERPIDRVEAEESTLSSYLAEIRTHQPKVFDLLEGSKSSMMARVKSFLGAVQLPRHKGPTMIDAERREKNRLRSERWRRAHGIGPRRPAQRPWLAEGISRSTWYRRKQGARQATSVACACATLERAEAFVAALTRDPARCAALERESMVILAELAALPWAAAGRQWFNPASPASATEQIAVLRQTLPANFTPYMDKQTSRQNPSFHTVSKIYAKSRR